MSQTVPAANREACTIQDYSLRRLDTPITANTFCSEAQESDWSNSKRQLDCSSKTPCASNAQCSLPTESCGRWSTMSDREGWKGCINTKYCGTWGTYKPDPSQALTGAVKPHSSAAVPVASIKIEQRVCQFSSADLLTIGTSTLEQCSAAAVATFGCSRGSPYFIYNSERKQCKCCTNENAISLTTADPEWNLYQTNLDQPTKYGCTQRKDQLNIVAANSVDMAHIVGGGTEIVVDVTKKYEPMLAYVQVVTKGGVIAHKKLILEMTKGCTITQARTTVETQLDQVKNGDYYGGVEDVQNLFGVRSQLCHLDTFITSSSETGTFVDKNKELCSDQKCSDYRGDQRTTRSGLTCQRWDVQTPHGHTNPGYDENFCRNPNNNEVTIWCYTIDPGTRWEYCDPIDDQKLIDYRVEKG